MNPDTQSPPPAGAAAPATLEAPDIAAAQLAAFIRRHPHLLILTGAGVSTDSGIPDYRDRDGAWKRQQPVQQRDFMHNLHTRRRYWGRSLVGWPLMQRSQPNPAHHSLAELEQRSHSELLVTQNVDRLHQRAGSQRVIDLHGRADQVVCMGCDFRCERAEVHRRSHDLNPEFHGFHADTAPDGDADLEVDFSGFRIVDCPHCGGILKPDVVFFGDTVPRHRVDAALAALRDSDGLLVVGSSLMVYSGFRFCRYAREWHKPIAALTLGRTRADDLLALKLDARIGETLAATLPML